MTKERGRIERMVESKKCVFCRYTFEPHRIKYNESKKYVKYEYKCPVCHKRYKELYRKGIYGENAKKNLTFVGIVLILLMSVFIILFMNRLIEEAIITIMTAIPFYIMFLIYLFEYIEYYKSQIEGAK